MKSFIITFATAANAALIAEECMTKFDLRGTSDDSKTSFTFDDTDQIL